LQTFRDHASEQKLEAKSQFNLKRFRSGAGRATDRSMEPRKTTIRRHRLRHHEPQPGSVRLAHLLRQSFDLATGQFGIDACAPGVMKFNLDSLEVDHA
jgi:hypothetical protein